jgi:ABC-2 type transport system ATP-binding protein
VIEVKGLSKQFGAIRAVDSVSFTVPKGQVLGFLGPNGAGKSTTMKMLTGFLAPTAGTAKIAGFDIVDNSIEVRKRLGYLPESAPSYGEMTVEEFLSFIAEMRGMRGQERDKACDRVREMCFLERVWFQPIETLSKGYRQRVGFAQALIHDPELLVLDEPTDGLDPNQKHEVRQLIKRMGENKTIILSTHILEEVEAVCHRAIIIAEGRLVADATPEALMQQSSLYNAVTVSMADSEVEKARSMLANIREVERVEPLELPGYLRVYPRNGKSIIGQVSQFARENQLKLDQLRVESGRLDEVFRKVTATSGANRGTIQTNRSQGA